MTLYRGITKLQYVLINIISEEGLVEIFDKWEAWQNLS